MGNRALVLSGGGAKGAFELGVVDYLVNDRGIYFDVICGVSTGALNASFLSQGKGYDGLKEKLEQLKQIWFSIESDDDIYLRRLDWNFFRLVALYDNSPLKEKIQKNLNEKEIKDSGVQFRIGVVSLNTGEYIAVNQDSPSLKEFVLASTAIPVIFSPVRHKGKLYVDGGVRNITPLQDAFKALKELPEKDGTDEVYVVLSSPLSIKKVSTSETDNILEILKRSVEIMTTEIYIEDLKYATEINEYIKQTENLKKQLSQYLDDETMKKIFSKVKFPHMKKSMKYVQMKVFEPDREYMDSLEFKPEKIKKAFQAGRKKAQEIMG
ncbi:MAG: hypothetical protein GXO99_00220 [Nitrospirae bacterium]|nr:hypothetical protein [Nitrospirota bacterium]